MGLGGVSPWQLLIILVVVLVIFGTKKLRTVGADLGGAVKDFKKAMNDDEVKDAEFKKIANDSKENLTAETSKEKEQA